MICVCEGRVVIGVCVSQRTAFGVGSLLSPLREFQGLNSSGHQACVASALPIFEPSLQAWKYFFETEYCCVCLKLIWNSSSLTSTGLAIEVQLCELDLAPRTWYTASFEVSASSLMQCTYISLPWVMTKEDLLCGHMRGSSKKLAVFSSTYLEYSVRWVQWYMPVIPPLARFSQVISGSSWAVWWDNTTFKKKYRGILLEIYENSSSLKWSEVPFGFDFYQ